MVLPGILATNAHVVSDELAHNLAIHFPSATGNDKGPTKADVVYKDEKRDLAFLSVRSTLAPLKVAQDFQFHRGQDITIIGCPGLGNSTVLENAITRGVLSTKMALDGQEYYQLGVSINPGNSGGPVFDSKGRVIGVATLRASKQEALGFCIPNEDLRTALDRVRLQSKDTADEAARHHRLQVICRLLTRVSGIYASGLDAYIKAMEEAIGRNEPAGRGLNLISQQIDPKVKAFDELFGSDLKSEISEVASSSTISPQVRQHLVDLWATYTSLKSYFDKPRGDLASFKAKINEMKDDRTKHVEALQLLLGINDDE
jgi:serine protease Do